MSKPELRQALRALRKSYVQWLNPEARTALESRLAENLRSLIERAPAVGGYHAVGSEIDVKPALMLAKAFALPTFGESDEPFRFRHGPVDSTGPHGISQPRVDAAELECALILVPLLGIDSTGHRLGQGGGHYDRVLPALRTRGAMLIGVGWDLQRIQFKLPAEPWDIALDGFCSPQGLEMFR